ncbi:MAG: AbrB/MazE/SpoVT family DNA-binding domain-containing protein [Candidatus Omnitrophica bacterium]|nr:AbrB/MazE/SpoVT family DNA-binding domain-containing protein [Candidatus Omnitrophota bacterium]
MTITMSAKHQVTIPKKIAAILGLKRGSMFDVAVRNNRIELVPLETIVKEFSDEVYGKLEKLSQEERGKEKRVTKKFISALRKGV